jgi:hypothetical protein
MLVSYSLSGDCAYRATRYANFIFYVHSFLIIKRSGRTGIGDAAGVAPFSHHLLRMKIKFFTKNCLIITFLSTVSWKTPSMDYFRNGFTRQIRKTRGFSRLTP